MEATAKRIDKVFYQAEFTCNLGNDGYSKVTGIGGGLVHGISARAEDGFVKHGWKVPFEVWDNSLAKEFKIEPKEGYEKTVEGMLMDVQ